MTDTDYPPFDDLMASDPNADDLSDFLIEALFADAKGEPIDHELVGMVAEFLVAAKLVHSGLDIDTVAEAMDRDHEVKIGYDGVDLELDLVFS